MLFSQRSICKILHFILYKFTTFSFFEFKHISASLYNDIPRVIYILNVLLWKDFLPKSQKF